ncbi:hypothetical protein GIB67_024374 [Kingdonia uniflora]|uniref:Sugar phosphate transporter domain-containing protein n=1 Tax=Kingdonia uniflora TaxID=39325 RepID=A0A7J7LFH1_9MAGN|nr:hypothetical protein GIB67_024374 [Kingdonia uniflora]
MFVSLIFTLKRVSKEVKKWRPAGADHGFTFLYYHLIVAYHRTNLLAHYGWWSASVNGGVLEGLGYKKGFRVDLDIPEGTWAEVPSFHDILILNTKHWWRAPSKFDPIKSPMLFFEKGLPVISPIKPEIGLDIILKNMIFYVNRRMRPAGIKIFCTQSPRHLEEGDWDHGGSCQRVQPLLLEQVNHFFSLERNGTNADTCRLRNQHMYKVLEGSNFHILDVSYMSECRASAHPSTAAFQFAIGTTLVLFMWIFNLHKRPKITSAQLVSILLLAIVYTMGNLFTNMSLGKVVVSFTHTINAMEPFFSILLSAMFLGELWHCHLST